ncbi:hypothetical protein CPB85DRAFT_1471554 [Mucidula mucida]|nr:hypothetical protein CPB85DRAFT_1471554 [Mucidula mucida]
MSSSQWLTLLCSDSPASQPDDQYTDHLLQVYRDYPRFNKPTDDTISRKPTVDDLESRLRFHKPNRRHVLPQVDRYTSTHALRFHKPNRRHVLPQADRLYALLFADELTVPHKPTYPKTTDSRRRKSTAHDRSQARHAPVPQADRRHVLPQADRLYATLPNPQADRLPHDSGCHKPNRRHVSPQVDRSTRLYGRIHDRCDLQETCCSCKSTASTPHFRIHKPTDHDYLTTSTLDSRCPKPNRRHVLPQVDRFPRLTMDEFVSLDCLGLKHDFLSSGAVSAARTILCDALHPALTSVDDRRNRSRAHQSLGSKSLARGKVQLFFVESVGITFLRILRRHQNIQTIRFFHQWNFKRMRQRKISWTAFIVR